MDGDDYTNALRLKDDKGRTRALITVREVKHYITYGVSNSAECLCGETFHGVMAEDLDIQVDAHMEEAGCGEEG